MLFRFIGRYTNGHTAINACGVVFQGHEPAEVTDPDGIRRLSGNPEFEAVTDAPQVPPAPRRKRKAR
jgi:hypothetical protein